MIDFKFIRNCSPLPISIGDEIFDKTVALFHTITEDSDEGIIRGIPFYVHNHHPSVATEMEPWYKELNELVFEPCHSCGTYSYGENSIIDLSTVLDKLNKYLLSIGKEEAYLSDEPE